MVGLHYNPYSIVIFGFMPRICNGKESTPALELANKDSIPSYILIAIYYMTFNCEPLNLI